MYSIYFTKENNSKVFEKEITDIEKFELFCKQVVSNDLIETIDYCKIWLLDLDENDDPIFVFKFVESLNEYKVVQIDNNFSTHLINEDNISKEYSKFICRAWGNLLYLDINRLPLYQNGDIYDF